MLGTANHMWQLWVVDVGMTRPDKGEGGEVLEGYDLVRSPSFGLWTPWRSFLVDGDPAPGAALVKQYTKIYPGSLLRWPLRRVLTAPGVRT